MLKRHLAAFVIAATVAGGGAYAWAQEDPEGPTGGERATQDERADRAAGEGRHRLRALRRAVHGDLVVGDAEGGYRTVSFDRGEVGDAGAGSLTLRRPDGAEVTKQVNGDTRFRGVAGPEDLRAGEPALVVSEGDVATLVAQRRRA